MFCPQCGAANPDDGRFCSQCGRQLRPSATRHDGPRWSLLALGIVAGLIVLFLILGSLAHPGGPLALTATATATSTSPVLDTVLTDTSATAPGPTETPGPFTRLISTADAPTQTPAQWAQGATNDSYADVNDHPALHIGDRVVWPCQINKFLPDNASLATVATCRVDSAGHEIALNVPLFIDVSAMHSGDYVKVYGTVDQPMEGTNGFGATITEPQIDVVYIDDAALWTPVPEGPMATATIDPMAGPGGP